MQTRPALNVSWPSGARAAVSLTYDGGLGSHRGVVAEQLGSYGHAGTFYVDPERVFDDPRSWQELQRRGHEIGNGCLLNAALEDGSLPLWTNEMIHADVESARTFLEQHFTPREHSFAFPLGSPKCGAGQDYRDVIEGIGYVARSGVEGHNAPGSCSLGYLRMVPLEGMSAEEAVSLAEIGVRAGTWTIFAIGRLGDGGRTTCLRTHREVCHWLWEVGADVWVSPVVTVAAHLRSVRSRQLRPA
jgi:hypothetical protein